ncbi:hypothetical protein [Chryseobacterium oranimense]|uniref:hypothetical protein n=1 Tax=Chryseobacterium oranimense TaxID=421058 RepID=UPI002236B788|nr:hypothetical protein [Chryseobacterium oranimense]
MGNVRVSFARNSAVALEIVDANDYYSFGMNHMKTGNAFFAQGSYKSYKFVGNELQETVTNPIDVGEVVVNALIKAIANNSGSILPNNCTLCYSGNGRNNLGITPPQILSL